MMNKNKENQQWVKSFLGDSFVKGISINDRYARVIVNTPEGHKEVNISLPNSSVNNNFTNAGQNS